MAIYQTGFCNVYEFSFEKQADGSYRAYIISQPPYGNRDSNSLLTHRLADGTRNYVCWDKPLLSREEAKKIAAGWAKRTDRYILTGQPFNKS